MSDDLLDTDHINGIPLARFCPTCRERIRAGIQSGTKKADICADCAATLFELGRTTSIESDQEAPRMTSQPLTFTEVKEQAPPHEMNLNPEEVWRWVEVDGRLMLLDATGQRVELDDPEVQRLIAAAPRLRRVVEMYLDDIASSDTTERAARALVDEIDGLAAPAPSSLMALIAEAQVAGRARGTFQAPEDQRVAARAVYLEEALDRMVKAWDRFTADTSCPACSVDLLDGGVHPAKSGPNAPDGTCPRAFAQQILDGVEP